jgi:tetratricopeptide (TPR) repeat protein
MLKPSDPRRVVPRWRSSWITAQTTEGKSNKAGVRPDFGPALARASAEFDALQAIPQAAELMFIAKQAQDVELAKKAASQILKAKDQISSASLIGAAKRIASVPASDAFVGATDQFLRDARGLLRQDFNNPVLLMDVAWAMTSNGHGERAAKFVRAALSLAPGSRFVLRAAARYYLHRGDREFAHHILASSALLGSDPWVQASEVAVATVLGKTSNLVKSRGRALDEATELGANLSELGSAIATVHLQAGNHKRAKRLFNKSLGHPNDNVVAQAEWASIKLPLVVSEKALSVKYSYEANSRHSYRNLDIDNAIAQAQFWREDEPFASRPLGWLAHLYAINDDFERAMEYYERLITSDQDNRTSNLLNQNFGRIETGALLEAGVQLAQLSRGPDASSHRIQIFANAGALAYAYGEIDSGRELYEKAAVMAKQRGEIETEALVRSYFARAAVKYSDPKGPEIVEETSKLPTLSVNPSATHIARRLVNDETRKRLEASAAKRVSKAKLIWDSVKNILSLE